MSEETKEDKIEQETVSTENNADEVKAETEEKKENTEKEEAGKKKKSKKLASAVAEILLYVMIAFVCIFLIPRYVVQRTEVSGESMENTLQNKDNILVEKLSYRFGKPERFDIIVFRHYYKDDGILMFCRKNGIQKKLKRS